MIPLSTPVLKGREWKYVKECLDTGWVSSVGKYVEFFEDAVAKYVGRKYAVACVSGTAALHISLLASGVKSGDEVIVPALTFVAPANAVRYVGAYPVFMDADPSYWQLDAVKLEEFLKRGCVYKGKVLINKATGRSVKAIIPVDILGHPVDMDAIRRLARKYNLVVIEDAAESLGAEYKGDKVGSKGDISCLSYNGNKVVTAGGGGMLLTDNKKVADYARYLTTQAKDDTLEYIHHEIGYNYRLTNVQAAIGLAQMECLDAYVAHKRAISKRYATGFKNIPGLILPKEAPWARSSWWLYTILVETKTFGQTSRQLLKVLHQQGIQSRPLWHPLPGLKPFRNCFAYRLEVTPQLYTKALSLPSSPNLTLKDQMTVIETLAREVR